MYSNDDSNSTVNALTTQEIALIFASRYRFPVFPLRPGTKEPYAGEGISAATIDSATIKRWFADRPAMNYGVSTAGLVVLDVDAADGKPGLASLEALGSRPDTLTVASPRGGLHLYFAGPGAGQRDLAPGINVRSIGGYVVGPGSVFEGKRYELDRDAPLAELPPEIRGRLSAPGERPEALDAIGDIDPPGSWDLAVAYLAHEEGAIKGERGISAYKLAARLKDMALSETTAYEVLSMYWAERCDPPKDPDELMACVTHAFMYGRNPQGCDNPLLEFEEVPEELRGPQTKSGLTFAPFEWVDPADIEPRDWLYGRHYIRRFVTATVAPGGLGKSSLVLVEALSMATGRALLGSKPARRCRVWAWNGEDPQDELTRRIMAICLHYGITKDELDGWLFVNSGRDTPIVLASDDRSGFKVATPVRHQLISEVRRLEVDVLIVDPFVACHRVSENDNARIEAVVSEWMHVADAGNCAVELVHHTRKLGGAEATAEDARGASALVNKARAARALNAMTPEEASEAGVPNRRLHFRVDDGKTNLAPPAEKATWYELVSVSLGNDRAGRAADHVGVVAAWEFPSAFSDLPVMAAVLVKQGLGDKAWRADPQAEDWAGWPIAAALGLEPEAGDTDRRALKNRLKKLIATYLAQGVLEKCEVEDAKRRMRPAIRACSTLEN